MFKSLDIPLIEDSAQALGTKFKGKLVGTFGKIATFSFYASKVITTGYGGMIFSEDKNIISKIKDYREFDCRRTYKPRFNFQMSDLQAAIGRVQLRKLPMMIKRRTNIANKYYDAFPSSNVWPMRDQKNITPNYYRFLLITKNPNNLKKFLNKYGIQTILPIERYELLHRYLKQDIKKFPVSEKIAKMVLSLPTFPLMLKSELSKIIEVIYHSKLIPISNQSI
jgi:perosamine synthetase